MPVITLQLGQCGNQLGASLFSALANEFQAGGHPRLEDQAWFRPVERSGASSTATHVARSVLIDMEPKVVQSAMATAAARKTWWRYPSDRHFCMHSGAGNNWAHGYHGYGPRVRDHALDLIRREAEACDVLGGFLMLQSMAGGTGAGLGTAVAQALRDEYPSSTAVSCCVWPYETGEVIVQPYNTLFTLSHLAAVSDGVIIMGNETLHKTANKLYNIARPSFQDMNHVAARSLSSLLLPSTTRPANTAHGTDNISISSPASSGTAAQHGHRGVDTTSDPWNYFKDDDQDEGYDAGPIRSSTGSSRPTRLLTDLVSHVTPHPGYRLMSLRALPQMPSKSVDFTTFTWPAITKRLKQMQITGNAMEEGLDWAITTTTTHRPQTSPQQTSATNHGARNTMDSQSGSHRKTESFKSPPARTYGSSGMKRVNKAYASWLVLRGQGAAAVDVGNGLLDDPGMYGPWSVDPLAVSYSTARFARCDMSAALLSSDQAAALPAGKMLDKAYSMFSSRAYVHQYEAYGLQPADFTDCFAAVEDILGRYQQLG